jgi:hypothetical protein
VDLRPNLTITPQHGFSGRAFYRIKKPRANSISAVHRLGGGI